MQDRQDWPDAPITSLKPLRNTLAGGNPVFVRSGVAALHAMPFGVLRNRSLPASRSIGPRWFAKAVGSLELLGPSTSTGTPIQAAADSATYDIRLGIPLVYDDASSLPDDQM